MSNHFSAKNLGSPGGDPRLDLTDLFVFPAPDDPGKTVLIMDVDPLRTDTLFHPDAIYRVNIDNDNDTHADVAFSVEFSEPAGGMQTGTAYYATGSQAREPEPKGETLVQSAPVGVNATAEPCQAGPARLFMGVRSDPFFADADGALHGFQWTGVDFFAGKDVLSIALEVPNDMLGTGAEVGAWATVSLRQNGTITQMDRGGNPTINPFINPDDVKDTFNSGDPADDVANYLQPWSKLLQDKGGYSPADSQTAALRFLPDILHYNRAEPSSYPNGRNLTDDVYSYRFAWLTNGKVGPDGLEPHEDMTRSFPFLGPPNGS